MNEYHNNFYKKGLVSFCCLSYKHGEFIKDCLDSIWNQDYKNIEIIAMDDGSPDNSGEILEEHAKLSPVPIEVILQNNSGNIAKNFNRLIKHSKGEYIFFIAMDDFIETDAISSKIAFFNENSNMVFVANKLNNKVNETNDYIAKNESPVNWGNEPHKTAKDLLEIEYKYIGSFYIQGALFQKNIIDKIGSFDEDLLGDDIILRTKIFLHMIKNPELTFKLLNKPAINYRMHGYNIHKNSFRQITLVKEWKDRYFPERKAPDLLFKWLYSAFNQSLDNYNLQNCAELINILDDLLNNENNNTKEKYIRSIFRDHTLIKSSYLLPFVFEIRYRKIRGERKTQLIVLGLNLLEVIKRKRGKIRKKIKILYITIYKK